MTVQLPADYRIPYIHSLEASYVRGVDLWPQYCTVMPTFGDSTDQSWSVLEPLLAGIDALYHEWTRDDPQTPASTYGQVARVEFTYRYSEFERVEYRGAVLFDSWKRPLLHAMNALLGYGGSGSNFSWQILNALGVPEEMFEEANSSVRAREYDGVVFSRETVGVMLAQEPVDDEGHHSGADDDLTLVSYPGAPVSNTWAWWVV